MLDACVADAQSGTPISCTDLATNWMPDGCRLHVALVNSGQLAGDKPEAAAAPEADSSGGSTDCPPTAPASPLPTGGGPDAQPATQPPPLPADAPPPAPQDPAAAATTAAAARLQAAAAHWADVARAAFATAQPRLVRRVAGGDAAVQQAAIAGGWLAAGGTASKVRGVYGLPCVRDLSLSRHARSQRLQGGVVQVDAQAQQI